MGLTYARPLMYRVKLRIEKKEGRKLDQRPAFVLSRPQMYKVGLWGTSFEIPKEGTTNPGLS